MCVAITLALALSGCATNPVTGDRELILMSTETERAIDEQGARAVEAQLGLVEDPELAAYVEAIGQRVAEHAPRQDVRYHFHVVAMDEPNAFALPGGHIYVSRGLLLLSNSEAELAGVLGHEIGHVEARHAAQRDALQKTLAVMSVLGAVGMAVGGPTSTGAPGPVGTPGYFAYSRSQESQADEIGMELAMAAGFDPRGIADFLSSLESHHRLTQGYSRETSYFDSHPATAERAAHAATEAEVLDFTPTFSLRGDRRAYLELLEGLSIGTPASEGVVVGQRFMHADLGIGVRFPPGYEVHNTRAAVVGISQSGQTWVVFEFEAPGDDAQAAARLYAERGGVQLDDLQSLKLGELEAVRARTAYAGMGGRVPAVITWVVYEGQIYRLTALSRGAGGPDLMALASSFARSFHALGDDERDAISAKELRVVEARVGESLAELGERTGNEWTPNETAVHNGLVATSRLEPGQLVKISKSVPYPAGRDGIVEVVIPAGTAPAGSLSGSDGERADGQVEGGDGGQEQDRK
jgi:predicted Zn-dependent protease